MQLNETRTDQSVNQSIDHKNKHSHIIIPSTDNRKDPEAEGSLCNSIQETQNNVCNISRDKHQFKAHEINFTAEIPSSHAGENM
jgi:hypothetical protein